MLTLPVQEPLCQWVAGVSVGSILLEGRLLVAAVTWM